MAPIIWLVLVMASLLAARTARADAPKIAVVDAEPIGVAAESATAVTRQLYATVARLGYLAVPESSTRAATSAPHMGGRDAGELYRIGHATRAALAISATLGALGERYTVSLTLVHTDGTPPAGQTAITDAASLEATVEAMTRAVLPPAPPAPSETETAQTVTTSTEERPKAVHRLSLNTEGAIGLTSAINESTPAQRPTFYNQVVGPRFDYGFPNDFAAGVFVGYANLKGKEGRASNVLAYAQLEYRTRVSKTSDFRIPLRMAAGYLPMNGPFLRLAGGISVPLGNGVHLGLDLVAPAVWVIGNRAVLSLDAGAEVGFDL